MSDIPTRDVAGDTVIDDRYRVISRLGSGGMADVYCAEDLQLGRKVALKLLYRRFAEDQEFVERFRREASAAAGLQHPNVVQVFDRGEWDGTYYIAMEFLEGRSLKQIIRDEGPLEPSRAVDIAIQILRATRFAHKRGVIHRDIKPHNVIVDPDGRVKVTDFGIARAGASDMTETGAIMGTAQYLSPEQAQGHAVSGASDIYSLGIVLYEMLTARVPFEAESAVTIALKQVSEAPVAPRSLNPAVSLELEDVVLTALQKDPRERFNDADEFIAELEAVRDVPSLPGGAQRTGAITGIYPALEETYPMPPRAYEPAPDEGRDARFWITIGVVLLALALLGYGAFKLLVPEQVEVPTVVGLSADAAATQLDNQGFDPSIETVPSKDIPRDQVTRQDPPGGESAPEGSTVTIYVSAGPGDAVVPDLFKRPTAEARAELEKLGFKVTYERRFDDIVRNGRVIETRPPGGSQAEVGTTVIVVVSRGRERVAVPDVSQLDREGARTALEDLDLRAEFRERETDEEDPGQVVEQDPAPGEEVEKGSRVTVTVAKEPSEVAVPDVEGAEVNDAVDALSDAGFRVRQRTIEVDTPDEDGFVVSQDPPRGTRRKKGSRVTITVGRFSPDLDPDPEPTPTPTPTPEPTP